MKLANAARRGDTTLLVDAYQPATRFYGQVAPFDDTLRDNLTAERRILSVAPEVEPPARRVVLLEDAAWIMGQAQLDFYRGRVIRKKYVLQRAVAQAAPRSLADVIADAPGEPLYVGRIWVKSYQDEQTGSAQYGLYDLIFAAGETVTEGALVQLEGRWLLLRTVYPSAAGFTCALADELAEPVRVAATFDGGAYDPVTDSRTSTPVTVTVIKLRWQAYYRYPTQASHKFTAGDDVIVVRKADATPKAGATFTLGGSTWNIVAVLDEGAHWSCHVRYR